LSEYIERFEFEDKPKQIIYRDEEPLKLTNEFRFYHNKHRFRKELNKLQFLFQESLKYPLHVAGIRDSYIKADYTENYLFMILTTPEIIKNTTQIIEEFIEKDIGKGCCYVKTNSDYLVILANNLVGIKKGIDRTGEILRQVLNDYLKRKEFDEFIKIKPFTLFDCD
jgi:hypothetical protein